MKTIASRTVGMAAALWIIAACAAAGGGPRPNIIFFLVDDLGWRDLACTGSTFYETPHIDALAAEGLRFTRAYAAHPRCVPSRYAIMTGKFPARAGVPGRSYNLEPEEQTFAEALKAAGYATFFAGKWHLSKRTEQEPQNQGFDVNIAGGAAGAPGSYFFPYNASKTKGHTTEAPLRGLEEGKEGEYLNDRLTDETLSFLRRHHEESPGTPFLAVLSHYAVHTPLEAKEADIKVFERKLEKMEMAGPAFADKDGTTKLRQDDPVYAAMIRNTDESLGRLIKLLDELGLAEDTVVLLTSDHGGLSNRGRNSQRRLATSNLPLRAGKGHLYEGGIRVPLIVRWPGRIKPGTESHEVVNGTDHFPTLLELAGLEPVEGLDGVSYLAACSGGGLSRKGPLFWHSPKGRPNSTGDHNSSAILRGPLKLIDFYDDGRQELYDVASDPGELKDLAAERPEASAELLAELTQWLKSINAYYDN